MKERLVGLDVAKVFACFLVVALHTCNTGTAVAVSSVLYYTGAIAIPMFFIVNGYLLFGKTEKDKWYSYKKIGRILFLTFLANTVLSVAMFAFSPSHYWLNPFGQIISNLVYQEGVLGQLWFFGALILIYTAFPLFDFLYRKKQKWFFVFSGIFIFAQIVVDLLNVYYAVHYGDIFQRHILQTFRIESHFSYFFIGGVLKILKPGIDKIFSSINFKTILIYSLLYLVAVGYQFIMVKNIYPDMYCEYFYDNVLIIALAVFTVLICRRIILRQCVAKFVSALAGLIMMVYIVHPFVIKGFMKFGTPKGAVLLIGVFVASMLLSWLIMKIPYAKNILKI